MTIDLATIATEENAGSSLATIINGYGAAPTTSELDWLRDLRSGSIVILQSLCTEMSGLLALTSEISSKSDMPHLISVRDLMCKRTVHGSAFSTCEIFYVSEPI